MCLFIVLAFSQPWLKASVQQNSTNLFLVKNNNNNYNSFVVQLAEIREKYFYNYISSCLDHFASTVLCIYNNMFLSYYFIPTFFEVATLFKLSYSKFNKIMMTVKYSFSHCFFRGKRYQQNMSLGFPPLLQSESFEGKKCKKVSSASKIISVKQIIGANEVMYSERPFQVVCFVRYCGCKSFVTCHFKPGRVQVNI